jgi:hypothetical protein
MKTLLQRPYMPFLIALGAALLVIVVAFAPAVWQTLTGAPPRAPVDESARPWQVQADAQGGVSAFGMRLPGTTLAQVARRWGDELQVAVMARRGEPGALEAYIDSYRDGGITGKMVLALGATPAQVASMRERSPRDQPVDADARRYALHGDDRDAVLAMPVVGLSFVPAVQLDAATLTHRFGTPAERLPAGEGAEQWLYPERGLAILLHDQTRELIQVVAPPDFERLLRAPLVQAMAAAAAASDASADSAAR